MRYIRFHTRNYPKFIPFVVSSHITAPHWRLTDVMRETHPRVFPTTLRILFFLSLRKKNRSAKDGSRTHRRFSKQSKRFAINRRKFPVAFNNWPSFAPFAQSFCLLIPNTSPLLSTLFSLLPCQTSSRFNSASWNLEVSPSLSPLPSFLIPMRRESWFTIYDQRKSKNTWKLSLQVSGYIDRFSANVNFNIQKVMVKRINLLLLLLKSKYFRND